MADAAALPAPRASIARRVFDNRVVRLVVLFVAVTMADGGVWAARANLLPLVPAADRGAAEIAFPLAGALAILLAYALLVRAMEHRWAGEIAPARAPAGLIGGALLGLALFGSVIAILTALGIAHVTATPGQSLLAAGNMAVLAAVGEELIVRGALFRITEEMFGTLVALIVSAVFFGAIHLANPGATLASGVAIMLEAGLLLAACYVLTRDLWLAIGLHFGWNFTEGGVFGAAVSGGQFKGLYHTTLTGPDLLAGGAFGAEGSIVAVGVCVAAALVLMTAAIRRGHWQGLRLRLNDGTP